MRGLFATVLAALALVGATACGGGGDDTAAPETATAPADTGAGGGGTETTPELTTCSATDHGLTLPEQDLPPPVVDVRERIFAAVSECDFEELEKIANEKGEGFEYTLGEGGESPAAFWRQVELNAADSPMYVLALILTMPFTRNEAGAYAWPSAYSENPTEADWQALLDNVLYTQQEVNTMRGSGSGYTGWRTAITADGDWQFFVEGD